MREHSDREFPQEPREQMNLAIQAVFNSWNADRAILYRRQERIPADLGTAVNVQSRWSSATLGMDSGTGVAFTRDPASGAQGIYGDYLQNAQGEDVVAGIRNTLPLHDLERIDKPAYDEAAADHGHAGGPLQGPLRHRVHDREQQALDAADAGGKRTAAAAFVIAAQFVDEGQIDLSEALQRVTGAQLAQLMFPTFDEKADKEQIAKGMNASPGAAVGKAVFDSHRAAEEAAKGEKVILVRRETNPDDLVGMIAAQGILTSRGGKTSHAAVVARGMGKTCVCGAEELEVDLRGPQVHRAGRGRRQRGRRGLHRRHQRQGLPRRGAGAVLAGRAVLRGQLSTDSDPLVAAVHRLIGHADEQRRLGVRANSDTPEDSERARRFGAQGIGLCRTEHMFLGDRRKLVEDLILAESDDERQAALDALEPLQKEDFVGIFTAMDGLPVTVRLIDPPLHEFLPDLTELSVKVAVAEAKGEDPGRDKTLLEAVQRLHEANPMLGLRGVRLGLVIPGLFGMQVKAIAEAAAERKKAGGDPSRRS